MSEQSLTLILDQGGSGSRALVFDAAGRPLAGARRAVETARPAPGRVEQSPEAVVASLREAALEAIGRLDAAQRSRISAAGLVCQRASLLAWDRDSGRALTPILSWQDTRAGAWLAAQRLDVAALQRTTGLHPNAHFGASKMRWCLQQVPALHSCVRPALAPLASYLVYALTRERAFLVDPANASRTLLMGLAEQAWSPALLDLFGIPRTLLPEIVPSRFDYGQLDLAGLSIPLRLLNGDQSAAAFAQGEPCADCAYVNIGTGAFIYRPLQRPRVTGPLLCSLLYTDGKRSIYALEGTVNGAASALQWLEADCAGQGEAFAPPTGGLLPQQADLPLFLNGIGGLGSPDWRADFSSRFIGDGDCAQRALAVVESLGFLLQRNFERLCAELPVPRRLFVSGGLSRIDDLCQLLANLTQVEVERLGEPEASARGAAYLLTGDAGCWLKSDGERFPAQPDERSRQRYRNWTQALQQALDH